MSKDKERQFVHALASPLAGIEMILESVIEDLASDPADAMGYKERLNDIMAGIEKMKVLLKERREEVLSDK
jgi:signal transduction histidine kinase